MRFLLASLAFICAALAACAGTAITGELLLDGPSTVVAVNNTLNAFFVEVPGGVDGMLVELTATDACAANGKITLRANALGSSTCAEPDDKANWDFNKTAYFSCVNSVYRATVAVWVPLTPTPTTDASSIVNLAFVGDHDFATATVRVLFPPTIGDNIEPTVIGLLPSTTAYEVDMPWYRVPDAGDAYNKFTTTGTVPLAMIAPAQLDSLSFPFLALRMVCTTLLTCPKLAVGPFGSENAFGTTLSVVSGGNLATAAVPVLSTPTAPGTIPGTLQFLYNEYVGSSPHFVAVTAAATAPAARVAVPWTGLAQDPASGRAEVTVTAPLQYPEGLYDRCGTPEAPAAVFEITVTGAEGTELPAAALDRLMFSVDSDAKSVSGAEIGWTGSLFAADASGYMDPLVYSDSAAGFNGLAQCSSIYDDSFWTKAAPETGKCVFNYVSNKVAASPLDYGMLFWAPKPGVYFFVVTFLAGGGDCPSEGSVTLTVNSLTHAPAQLQKQTSELSDFAIDLADPTVYSLQSFLLPVHLGDPALQLYWFATTGAAANVCFRQALAGDPDSFADNTLTKALASASAVCLASGAADDRFASFYTTVLDGGDWTPLEDPAGSHAPPLAPGFYVFSVWTSAAQPLSGTLRVASADTTFEAVTIVLPQETPFQLSDFPHGVSLVPDVPFLPGAAVELSYTLDAAAAAGTGAFTYATVAANPSSAPAMTSQADLVTLIADKRVLGTTVAAGADPVALKIQDASDDWVRGFFAPAMPDGRTFPFLTVARDPDHPEVPLSGEVKMAYDTYCIKSATDAVDGLVLELQHTPVCACPTGLSGPVCGDVGPASDTAFLWPGMTFYFDVTLSADVTTSVDLDVSSTTTTQGTFTHKLLLRVFDPNTGLELEHLGSKDTFNVTASDPVRPLVFGPALGNAFPGEPGLRIAITNLYQHPRLSTPPPVVTDAFYIRASVEYGAKSCPSNCHGNGNCLVDADGATACVCTAGFVLGPDKDCAQRCPDGMQADPTVDSSACVPCPTGTAGSDGFCALCGPNFAPSDDRSVCTLCPDGTHANSGDDTCTATDCGSGWVPDGHGCRECVPGYFAARGDTDCSQCPAGTWSAEHAADCTPCAEGDYAPAGSASCATCGVGSFTDGATCTACPVGSFNPFQGATECSACPEGTYSEKPGAILCADCPAGSFSATLGATGCTLCPPGDYQPDTGAIGCKTCPPGDYEPVAGASGCTECEAGFYAPDPAESTCLACPGGTYSSPGASRCTPCPPGFYSNADAASLCDKCPEGLYQPNQGQTSCLTCPAGTHSAFSGWACNACSGGTYAPAGSANCDACPSGTYSDDGAGTCMACGAGSYSGNGASACSLCPAGMFSGANASTCAPCNPGYYSDVGAAVCSHCEAGTYATFPNTAECSQCRAGTYSDPGATECTPCPVGSFAQTRGCPVCALCPAGLYSPAEGASACLACPAGQYSLVGSFTCAKCSPGTFSEEASAYCDTCAPGTFSSYSGAATCQDCPAGSFAASPGSLSCAMCPAGQYSAFTAQSACMKCPEDTFGPSDGTVTCSTCPHKLLSGVAPPGSTSCPTSTPKVVLLILLVVAVIAAAVAGAILVGRREGHAAAHTSARAPLIAVDTD
jgi:hypothetical protein